MSLDAIERDSEGFTAVYSVDREVNEGIERMLNKIKLLELDWRLEELANDTPSLALEWLVTSARHELGKGNLCTTLVWVRKAFQLAWSRTDIRDKIDKCVDLIYRFDQTVFASAIWGLLPEVHSKTVALESQLSRICPLMENVYKRTRQHNVRMYIFYFDLYSGVTRLEYLMNAEFIAAYNSRVSTHTAIQNVLALVLGKGK